MVIPRLPDLPPPAECTKKAFAQFSRELSALPVGFMGLGQEDQARETLRLKAADTLQYQTLLGQAQRCAR